MPHPIQLTFHTMVGSLWGTDGWFRRSDVHEEAHFGIGMGGETLQWIDTARTADAQYRANPWTISVECEDKRHPERPFTDAQTNAMIRLGRWALATHPQISRRLTPAWNTPGVGWHSMFRQWSKYAGKTCPAERLHPPGIRIVQLRDEIIPAIVGTIKEKTMWPPKAVVYGKRGTPDYDSACVAADQVPGGVVVTCDLAVARAAAEAGVTVFALGGPARAELAKVAGVHAVVGETGAETLAQAARLAGRNWAA